MILPFLTSFLTLPLIFYFITIYFPDKLFTYPEDLQPSNDIDTISSHTKTKIDSKKSPSPHILLLIAHPDDESMFFAPTLLALKGKIRVLCLSTGNYDGLGHIRKKELLKACRTFDILPECVTILDTP